MNTLSLIAAILLAWLLSHLYNIFRHYQSARHSGFRVLLCPVNPDNAVYIVLKNQLRPLFERTLPRALYERLLMTTYGWEFKTKWTMHAKFGKAFMMSTPAHNEVWVADAEIATAVTTRRKDFIILPMTKKIMGILGSNLLVVRIQQVSYVLVAKHLAVKEV
jgi:hypothetical protein